MDPGKGLRRCNQPKASKSRIDEYENSLRWVFPKIGGGYPKMDGENNGKPY